MEGRIMFGKPKMSKVSGGFSIEFLSIFPFHSFLVNTSQKCLQLMYKGLIDTIGCNNTPQSIPYIIQNNFGAFGINWVSLVQGSKIDKNGVIFQIRDITVISEHGPCTYELDHKLKRRHCNHVLVI